MEFAAGAGVAPRLRLRQLPAGPVPGRNRWVRVGGGAIGIGWARRATAPELSLAPAVARRAVSAAGGGHLLHGRVGFVVRSTGDGGGRVGFRGEDAEGDRSPAVRASPLDGAKGATPAR